eukprot:TRINITY_DN1902_c0_g3_i1.p1 TRINITY_DN1902_c0_g3~~TRINITY_DN1902_c0_g3_i1.p1  ORF type:complete len:125 (-),score=12.10 TRINITY_DN1902_c0_g3_i1:84-434(-)
MENIDPETFQPEIIKSEEEWESSLSEFEFQVLRQKGTEPAKSGEYDKFYPKKGHFKCKACNNPLYPYKAKFNSGCGWPAFDRCYDNSIVTSIDTSFGIERIEIMCKKMLGTFRTCF